jgi:hypothetical protein
MVAVLAIVSHRLRGFYDQQKWIPPGDTYGETTDENRRWNITTQHTIVFSFHHHKITTEVSDRGPDS